MTINRRKPGWAVTLMKYLASIVPLIFLPNTLIWSKTTFAASNLMNFAELVENEPKKFKNVPVSIQFIIAYCKDFKSLSLNNLISLV